MADAESLANGQIERLAEDESLRGELSDDGYQPLQDWAFARLTALAQVAVKRSDAEAWMETAAQGVRALLQAAVQAATSGSTADLVAQAQKPAVRRDERGAILTALRSLKLSGDADANAQAIAGALNAGAPPAAQGAQP